MAILRIGVIGLGKIGRIHLQHLYSMPQVQVVAVADTSIGTQEGIGSGTECFDDWHKITSHPQIDAVVICLPHSMHVACAKDALAHGKHVFLEKPIAVTFTEAQKLSEFAEEKELRLMVNMTHRFYAPLREAKTLLNEGKIGKIISVRDYYMEIIDRRDFPSWFFDPIQAGGGVAITDAIHLIDRIKWLLDEPLYFVAGTARYMKPDTEVEDCVEILCHSHSLTPVVVGSFFSDGPKFWSDGLTIFGTLGSLTVNAWSHLTYQIYGQPEIRIDCYGSIPLDQRAAVGHRAALVEFVTGLEENRPFESEAKSVLNAQEVVQDFYNSLASR